MATKKATKKSNAEKPAVQRPVQKYIVRCDRAGVFYGEIARHMGPYVVLRNVRKIWYWDGACAVEELAVNGTVDPKSCRLTVKVDEMAVSGVVQMIPCTKKAADALDGIKEWKRAKED